MTPREIVEKWIEAGFDDDDPVIWRGVAEIMAGMEADIQAAVEAEREACASLCEEGFINVKCNAWEADGVVRETRNELAKAIRARSTASHSAEPAEK
jgi:hypothetical protein